MTRRDARPKPVLEECPLDDPAAAALMAASVAEIAARYGGRPGSGAPPLPDEFVRPRGVFLLARLGGRPVGCGGLAWLEPGIAEVRRMYVVPEVRGRGIARAILDGLVAAARELAYERVRLETGVRQTEALGLYRSAGFAEIPCWGPYATDPISVCLELGL